MPLDSIDCKSYADKIYEECLSAAGAKRDARIKLAQEKLFGKFKPPPNSNELLVPGVVHEAIKARIDCQEAPLCIRESGRGVYAPGIPGNPLCSSNDCAEDVEKFPYCTYKTKSCGNQGSSLQSRACQECNNIYNNIYNKGYEEYQKEIDAANKEWAESVGTNYPPFNTPPIPCNCCDKRKKAEDACKQNGKPPLPPVIRPGGGVVVPPVPIKFPEVIIDPVKRISQREGVSGWEA